MLAATLTNLPLLLVVVCCFQGLTHTGALRCTTTANVINRQPTGCTPDWYGDQTSFMGSGPDLLLPNAMKYRVSAAGSS